MMADNVLYHVFFESFDEGIGYYIGSGKGKDSARRLGESVCILFDKFGDYEDKPQEFREIIKTWTEYNIFPETQCTLSSFIKSVVFSPIGMTNALVIESNVPNFVAKYIRFRSSTQKELFPSEPNENCVMCQYKEKRQIAQYKLLRKQKVPETKNIIIINIPRLLLRIKDFHLFKDKKIEVTQRFFDIMEYTDDILISIKDKNIRNEIVDFDNYFRNDILLRALRYDEKKNVLYLDLEDVR